MSQSSTLKFCIAVLMFASTVAAQEMPASQPSGLGSPGGHEDAGLPHIAPDGGLRREFVAELSNVFAGTSMPSGTSEPAATIAPGPIFAPFSTIAPIPMSASSSTTQPCNTTL